MQMLNHQYRAEDGATDVLSFSFRGETDDNLSLLGEIIMNGYLQLNSACVIPFFH